MARASSREAIVQSAVAEFHRRGFNACSVEDITQAAGVPKGSFYNHFKSKEELGAESVRRFAAASAFRADIADGLSPLGELRARFSALRDQMADRGFERGCLLGNMGTEVSDQSPLIRAEVENSLAAWSQRIAVLLRAAQAAGDITATDDPELLAEFIVNSWEGAITRAKVVKAGQPFDDFFVVVFDRLLR